MTLDQLLAAAGITPEQLVSYLGRLAILGDIAAKRAEVAREQAARQASIDAHDATLRALQAELAALEVQANVILAPGIG